MPAAVGRTLQAEEIAVSLHPPLPLGDGSPDEPVVSCGVAAHGRSSVALLRHLGACKPDLLL
eukprot:5331426-Alexandrium_andersonii.AAC.1